MVVDEAHHLSFPLALGDGAHHLSFPLGMGERKTRQPGALTPQWLSFPCVGESEAEKHRVDVLLSFPRGMGDSETEFGVHVPLQLSFPMEAGKS